jgi:hypothetical protein
MRNYEEKLQTACYHWFTLQYSIYRGLLFHVPNGGSRKSAAEGARFKRMGVVPGVADFVFLFNKTAYLIELKSGSGKQQDTQKDFQNTVEKHGFEYHIIHSVDGFRKLIDSIIKKEL